MDGRLELEERTISVPDLEAMYSEHPRKAALAHRPHLAYEQLDALVYECEQYLEYETLEDGRMFFFTPKAYERMDRRRIQTLKKNILYDRPEWVRDIKDKMRLDNSIYWIVNLSDVPPYPGVAIVEALLERGYDSGYED